MSAMTLDRPMTGTLTFQATRPRARAAHPVSHAGPVRLTRRGRVVVVLAALTAMLTFGVVSGAGSVATDQAGMPEATRIVMVDPGETLWGIASELAADGDVRAMVDHIERLNALESAKLTVGQRLRVPIAG